LMSAWTLLRELFRGLSGGVVARKREVPFHCDK
jgi:hypothetical protein